MLQGDADVHLRFGLKSNPAAPNSVYRGVNFTQSLDPNDTLFYLVHPLQSPSDSHPTGISNDEFMENRSFHSVLK